MHMRKGSDPLSKLYSPKLSSSSSSSAASSPARTCNERGVEGRGAAGRGAAGLAAEELVPAGRGACADDRVLKDGWETLPWKAARRALRLDQGTTCHVSSTPAKRDIPKPATYVAVADGAPDTATTADVARRAGN